MGSDSILTPPPFCANTYNKFPPRSNMNLKFLWLTANAVYSIRQKSNYCNIISNIFFTTGNAIKSVLDLKGDVWSMDSVVFHQ